MTTPLTPMTNEQQLHAFRLQRAVDSADAELAEFAIAAQRRGRGGVVIGVIVFLAVAAAVLGICWATGNLWPAGFIIAAVFGGLCALGSGLHAGMESDEVLEKHRAARAACRTRRDALDDYLAETAFKNLIGGGVPSGAAGGTVLFGEHDVVELRSLGGVVDTMKVPRETTAGGYNTVDVHGLTPSDVVTLRMLGRREFGRNERIVLPSGIALSGATARALLNEMDADTSEAPHADGKYLGDHWIETQKLRAIGKYKRGRP